MTHAAVTRIQLRRRTEKLAPSSANVGMKVYVGPLALECRRRPASIDRARANARITKSNEKVVGCPAARLDRHIMKNGQGPAQRARASTRLGAAPLGGPDFPTLLSIAEFGHQFLADLPLVSVARGSGRALTFFICCRSRRAAGTSNYLLVRFE